MFVWLPLKSLKMFFVAIDLTSQLYSGSVYIIILRFSYYQIFEEPRFAKNFDLPQKFLYYLAQISKMTDKVESVRPIKVGSVVPVTLESVAPVEVKKVTETDFTQNRIGNETTMGRYALKLMGNLPGKIFIYINESFGGLGELVVRRRDLGEPLEWLLFEDQRSLLNEFIKGHTPVNLLARLKSPNWGHTW